MERRRSQISALPVVDGEGRALGLLRIHDIYLGRDSTGQRPRNPKLTVSCWNYISLTQR